MNVLAGPARAVAGPGAVRIVCTGAWMRPLPLGATAALPWLAAQASALWPHGRWAWQRLADGSDEPLGLLALLAAAALWWRMAPQLREEPQPAWLAAAALLTALATAALWLLPPLACGALAMLALACGAAAWWPLRAPRVAWAGLLVLALPLLASLQFYAGYPLRVATAQLSTWALQLAGLAVQRSGTAMTVQGQLVLVDAPCSGVQMAWLAYFCACTAAAWQGAPSDRSFLRRLPLVSALVLLGNALRNTVLVVLEAHSGGAAAWEHETVGVVVLVLVCAAVLHVMRARPAHATHSEWAT